MATRAPAAVRRARTEDAPALAVLAGQLGYPTTTEALAARLSEVIAGADAIVLVAFGADGVHGWLHVELKRSLLVPLVAQVMGLVVDERRRSEGIGAALLTAGEAWAREQGGKTMLVGTRVTRERAHRFYRKAGYDLLKTSHFFEKAL